MAAILFHGPANNAFQIARKRRIQTERRDRLLVQDRVQRGNHVAGGKRLLAGGHFVEHDAQRKQVAALVQFLAPRLLRRHVNRRSRNHAHRGQRIFQRLLFRSLVARRFGQTKIEDFGLPALRHKDIGGLDVAVNDAFGVRSRQSVGHLNADVENLIDFHRLPAEALFQAYALELLHDNEGMSGVVVDVVDGANAGMVQLGSGASFAQEAFERLGVVHHLLGNELEGDVTCEAGVFRLIHHTHAATTELSHDVVVGDCLADHSEGLSAFGGNGRPLAKSRSTLTRNKIRAVLRDCGWRRFRIFFGAPRPDWVPQWW